MARIFDASLRLMKRAITAMLILLILAPQLLVKRATAEEVIKIVSSLPRTGSANGQTTSIVNGIKLALSEANYKAGDFKLVYEDWDDASPERGTWDPALEAANAERAVNDAEVMAYIGPYNSGAAKISMPKLNQAGLVCINPGTTWPGLTKPGIGEPNEPDVYRPSGKVTFFRVVPADDIQGSVGAEWAKDMGVKKIFVLHDRELYGKGLADVFQKSAKKLGIEVLGFEGIDSKAANYKSLAVKIRAKRPELIFFGGTTQSNAGQLMKDIVGAGVDAKIMAPDGCFENAFIQSAGPATLEGRTYLTFGGVPPKQLTGKGHEFYEHYKRAYQMEPEAYAVYGYEAGKVAVDAIRRAGKKDRAAILAAVAETKDLDAALGKWSFDANGDTTLRTMSGSMVKNGAFEFVKLLGD
jgi:branched-chain amino acid transport system substrate-binding protein